MLYRYHGALDQDEPMPIAVELPVVEADDPMAAVARLANDGLLPSDGTFWVKRANARLQSRSKSRLPLAASSDRHP
jgi:hypothetical protein